MKSTAPGYPKPSLAQGKYLHPQYLSELSRLTTEITASPRNLLLLLGKTAAWAIMDATSITAIRGTISTTPLGIKQLSTYHPAMLFRDWGKVPIVSADLLKAERESYFPDIRRPKRKVLVNPTLSEVLELEPLLRSCPILSVDIETAGRTITEVGFAPSKDFSIVIPLYAPFRPNASYWTEKEEIQILLFFRRVLGEPKTKKLFQNGMYDINWFYRHGILVINAVEDTMLLHHALFPEMPKGLGFMGSIYTNESSWKLMNSKKAKDQLKAEE